MRYRETMRKSGSPSADPADSDIVTIDSNANPAIEPSTCVLLEDESDDELLSTDIPTGADDDLASVMDRVVESVGLTAWC